MLSQPTNGAAANDFLVAATAIKRTDHGVGDLPALPGELEALGEALRAAARAYEKSASRVVPAAQPLDPGICARYQRAAANWPASPPPSHERFAATLASLHGAAAAARLAARRGDQARQAVDLLLGSESTRIAIRS
jgi:hypothetical protein